MTAKLDIVIKAEIGVEDGREMPRRRHRGNVVAWKVAR
jgi:hypothetical protein